MSESSSSRLARQWPELAEAITALTVPQRNAFAIAVSGAAMKASALDNVFVLDALAQARVGELLETGLLAELAAVVEQLDESAWTISEAVERGDADYSAYEAEFTKARAANSMWFAINTAEPHFAHEATYEAIAANTELSVIRELMQDALTTL
jgi:hypothetical protein